MAYARGGSLSRLKKWDKGSLLWDYLFVPLLGGGLLGSSLLVLYSIFVMGYCFLLLFLRFVNTF